MDKLLVIVVTYNGMRWLDKCLSSVVNSSIEADLFIVDNGSTDGSIDFIKNNHPEAKLTISEENLGFGKANNLGLQYALDQGYDYVYLLNQDAWVEKDTFEKLIAVSKTHPEYGILSPLQTNASKTALDNFFCINCPCRMVSDSIMGQSKNIYETKFVMAAHWLLPISIVKSVGGFSPTFIHYAEDDNLIDRIHFWGYKVGIVTNAIGIHDREFRESSIDKKIHISTMHWRRDFCNPLDSKKQKTKKIARTLIPMLARYPLITLRKLSDFVIDIHKMNKNYKLSKKERAFLK